MLGFGLAKIAGVLGGKFFDSKTALAKNAGEIIKTQSVLQGKKIYAQSAYMLAEAKGGFFQSGPRPAMMWFGVIACFNNFIIAPYFHFFGRAIPIIDLPDALWTLITLLMVGRGVEKGVKWKMASNNVPNISGNSGNSASNKKPKRKKLRIVPHPLNKKG